MESFKREPLIFWREVPVDVERGAFEYISKSWGNNVIFICNNDYSSERKQCDWKAESLNQIILEHEADKNEIIRKLFEKHPDAIHVFSGFRGDFKYILKRYSKQKKTKLCILAERPCYYIDNKLKNYVSNILYKYYSLVYSRKVDLFLAMGEKGVNIYSKLGFNKERIFPFMYNPLIQTMNKNDNLSVNPEEVKLLYIGRLSARFKGLNILLDSIKMINGNNWRLDIVGGYGDLKEKVISFSEKHKNIKYLGTWSSEEVVSKIREYDLCIIPSLGDGWNLIANEAINAGVGAIITDEAISDELIRASGAGIIVPAGDTIELAKAIDSVLKNPVIIDGFKEKAKRYSHRISSEVVGQYFMDIMDYTFSNSSIERPKCPWLT